MPIYEYACPSCGETFEALKRLSEEKESETCPKCGGKARKAGLSLFRSAPSGGGKGSCGTGGGKSSPFR